MMKIDLGNKPLVMPGDSLLPIDVRNEAESILINSGYVEAILIELPKNVTAPYVSVLFPNEIGMCDTINLDASLSTGGGPYGLNFDWEANVDGKFFSLQDLGIISEINEPQIELESSLLTPGTQNLFRVTVSSILTQLNSSQTFLIYVSLFDIPTIYMGQSTLNIRRYHEVLLTATISGPKCTSTIERGLTYEWRVENSILKNGSSTGLTSAHLESETYINSEYLLVPSFLLTSGSTTTINLTVTTQSNLSSSSLTVVS